MAKLPNGQMADLESLGKLFYKLIRVLELLRTSSSPDYLKHVCRSLEALLCGDRLRINPKQPPKAEREVIGSEWLELFGACQEFMRTWRESHRLVLDMEHVAWCLDQLGRGFWLNYSYEPNFRPVSEQLVAFVDYDKVVRDRSRFNANYHGIADADFASVQKGIEAGVFTAGDLLFYCHDGNALLTAEITRAYINDWVGGIYGSDEPCLSGTPKEESIFGKGYVRESACSGNFPRPNGFYVKRLPEFTDGNRFATGKDYASIPEVEQAAAAIWPMSSEAFQLFGVTHKPYADLRRPEVLALPGFCVKEWDSCHAGGPDWDRKREMYGEKNINLLTIGPRSSLPLGNLCRRTKPLTEEIGFGFLESCRPAEPAPEKDTACATCKKPLYLYNGFTICSFCGSIKSRG